jgi:hypothetical protein
MYSLKLKIAQVWVETAVYTLIGLTVIAIILATAVPQIDKIKDRAIIEQTISAMNTLDAKIAEVEQNPGNIRSVSFKVSKGSLEIDGEKNQIRYVLEDTKLAASEPDTEVKQGNIIMKTEKTGSKYKINLIIRYENLNITYSDEDKLKTLNSGSTPYKILMENKDLNSINGKINIDFTTV